MNECWTVPEGVEAVLEPTEGGKKETVYAPWMLAADGAHSTAREQLGIEFAGSSFAHEWYLADVPLRSELEIDRVHIYLRNEGEFLFLIPVIDEAWRARRDTLWRIIVNRPDPLAHLAEAEPAGPAVWESNFHISHRLDATMARGNVYFAGDAAHIHSPAGARGMNLGIEDAWVFSELVRTGRMDEYDHLRRPVDRQVVRRVELLSWIVAAESWLPRFLREHIFPMVLRTPMLRAQIVPALTGLDHELPNLSASA
jgi:2-polyprenyl-6-methoxyphenol hydroxylase-like FAD-dependent oxidoreductase